MKYEQMIISNENTVKSIAEFIKLIFKDNNIISDKAIISTIKNTSFGNLQKQEKEKGFEEATSSKFFRNGKSNQWKKILTKEQINLIEKKLQVIMKRLGYL